MTQSTTGKPRAEPAVPSMVHSVRTGVIGGAAMARVVDVPSFTIAHIGYAFVMGIYVARAKKVPV